jgi:outer membrane protein assembly factor BamB
MLLFSVHGGQKGDRVVKCELSGKQQWINAEKLHHPQMLQVQQDGTLLCGTQDGAHLLNAAGQTVWKYNVPEGAQNCFAKQLSENRFLVGNEGLGRFVEIDRKGNELHEIPLEELPDRKHGQFRYCTITREDTYLVPVLCAGSLREYDRNGTILNEIGDLRQVTYAQRLDDGGILVSFRGTIREYAPDWKTVRWEFSLSEDAGLPVMPIINYVRLPDGHLLMSLYNGKDGPDLIEINADKQLIHQWEFPDCVRVAHLVVLPPSHSFVKAAQQTK